ncbi:prepilin-type N-terminal cleavage/methylation domain-containing protein [bacterium]|nr:prepilin-type N-terminal cleavage/methylation domain-containing protein [bacterium]
MNFLKNKNRGFTLMEISITMLIIGILVMLSIPIIKGQLKKTEEYSYYLAFKTVEKLGSQIVSYGDPDLAYSNSFDNNLFKSSNKKVFNLFNFVFPKSYADVPELISWTSYQYNLARICLGAQNVIKSNDGGNIVYWTNTDPEISALCKDVDFYYNLFVNPSVCSISKSNFKNKILSESNPETFCKTYLTSSCNPKNNIKIDTPLYKSVSSAFNENISSYYECIVSQKEHSLTGSSSDLSVESNRTSSHTDCSINSWRHSSDCSCIAPAKNNSHVCCDAIGKYAVYENGVYTCVSSSHGYDYNEANNVFCSENSDYSYSQRACSCKDGYSLNDSGVCIEYNNCQKGSTFDNASKSCIANSPIVKAKRFCELITENWNISESHCDTFTNDNGISYYEDVFNAVNYSSEDGNSYLSINSLNKSKNASLKNAFKNITPNIVFSNGLRLWILGDKSASIAGLSYDPTDYDKDVNICKDTGAHSTSACTGGNKYFCKAENHCFDIKSGNTSLKLKDARNCCRTLDVSDIIDSYSAKGYRRDPRDYAVNGFTVFVDINGAKDDNDAYGGTLWNDVFPFYVSASGKVYPGYPLDADKNSSKLYIGGNSTYLSADVYYFKNTDKGRKRIVAYPSVPYSRALCYAKEISAYTPYCQNLGSFHEYNEFKKNNEGSNTNIDQFFYSSDNICNSNRCFIHIKNKFKFL